MCTQKSIAFILEITNTKPTSTKILGLIALSALTSFQSTTNATTPLIEAHREVIPEKIRTETYHHTNTLNGKFVPDELPYRHKKAEKSLTIKDRIVGALVGEVVGEIIGLPLIGGLMGAIFGLPNLVETAEQSGTVGKVLLGLLLVPITVVLAIRAALALIVAIPLLLIASPIIAIVSIPILVVVGVVKIVKGLKRVLLGSSKKNAVVNVQQGQR